MISLVIPTYAEARNIERLIGRAGSALAATGEDFELIIVDDSSPDGTADIVRGLQARRPWLRLLSRENERDLSTAVVAGWRAARGDVLGCMDADLQHPPETLPKLLHRLRNGSAQIVIASRNVHGGGVSKWSLHRRLLSWAATLMATFILPGTLGQVRDPLSGFFLIRRSVVDGPSLSPVGYKILLEVLAKGNYEQVEEVPYIFEERAEGGSKWRASTVFGYLVHLARLSFETREVVRMVKFAIVGLSGVVVNFVIASWLVKRAGWTVPWGALAGAALAVVNNFIWNEHFTFWETHRKEPAWSKVALRFVAFVAISAPGVALNMVVTTHLATRVGWALVPAVLAGIGVAALWNFFANANFTWKAWWNRKLLLQAASREREAGQVVHTPEDLKSTGEETRGAERTSRPGQPSMRARR